MGGGVESGVEAAENASANVSALDVMDNKIVDQVVASPEVPAQKQVDALDVLSKKVESADIPGSADVGVLDKVGSDFD